MASKGNTRNTTTSRKKTTTNRKKTSTKKQKEINPITNEIVLLLTIGFVILVFLSLIGVCGTAGDVISTPIFGIFGMLGFLFPFVMALGIFLLMANNFSGASKIKTLGLGLTYISVCGVFQMMDNRTDSVDSSFALIYSSCASGHIGGGVVGAAINKLLSPFGFGATVILFILIIVGLVILTEKSFINGVKESSSKVYNKTKENIENYKIDARETQLKRMEKKVSGVVTDIQIPKDGIKSEQIRKISEKVQGKPDKYQEDIFEIEPVTSKDDVKTIPSFDEATILKPEKKTVPYIDRILSETDNDLVGDLDKNDKEAVEVLKNLNETKHSTEKINTTEDVKTNTEITKASDVALKATNDNSDKAGKEVENQLEKAQEKEINNYQFPPLSLLNEVKKKANAGKNTENVETAKMLQQTLQSFGVNVTITDVSCGPSVTRYELLPERGTKVSKIVSLADDIKLNLAAADIRIEAPIPGKAAVGIEVPNKEAVGVSLRELLESDEFKNHPSDIAFAAGKDIAGKVIVADIGKMPHLLIAGATGSGKSVCINTIIMSILYKANPEDVKLIMVDPKVVELSVYNGIPHLMIPVVTDPKKASQALNWAVAEMEDRYKKFAEVGARDLKGYNEKIAAIEDIEDENKPKKLPQIVIIVDELADLMMVAPGEVEDAICRLAQLARACGIHLVIATQRPSVNVITGLIKANVPSRIAFSVSSGVDSRTIIDMVGAEKLLGKGDMLFYPSGYPKPVRAQGAFVSDKEVSNVVDFLSANKEAVSYNEEVINVVNNVSMSESQAFGSDRDQYFEEAGRFVIEKEKASIGLIQRFYKVGFNRAARIMDQLCEAGVVGPEEGTKPRKVLMSMEEFEEFLKGGN